MNVPIEIIVVFLTAFLSAIGGVFVAINNSTKAINSINITLAKFKVSSDFEEKECKTRHVYVNLKFKKTDEKLENHEKRISKLEPK